MVAATGVAESDGDEFEALADFFVLHVLAAIT
jgi:hypothetical protein